MRKTTNNSNYRSGPSERSSYHHAPPVNTDRKCDNCRYKVPINECSTFKCKDCGTYNVMITNKPHLI